MFVCVDVYVCEHHVFVCTCTFVCTQECTCVHLCSHEFLCANLYVCMCVQERMHTRVHAYGFPKQDGQKYRQVYLRGKVLPETQTELQQFNPTVTS